MGKPPVLIVGIATFAAGLAAGMFLRRSPDTPPGKPSRAEEKRSVASPAPGGTPAAPDVDASVQLHRTIEVQKERIRELETRLVDVERKAGGVKTKAEKLAVAKEILELFRRMSKGTNDSDETLKAMARLSELDADMASYFIERYKEDRGKGEPEAQMTLFLALACGGPDVAALLLGSLTNPSTPATERQVLLQGVSGGGGLYPMSKIPVNEELAQVAYRLAASSDLAERAGGAGLLGGVDAVQARGALQQMAFNDADLNVRTAALRSLGYAGDRSTLQLLESYALPPAPADDPKNPYQNWQYKTMAQALESAKERLKKRFPP